MYHVPTASGPRIPHAHVHLKCSRHPSRSLPDPVRDGRLVSCWRSRSQLPAPRYGRHIPEGSPPRPPKRSRTWDIPSPSSRKPTEADPYMTGDSSRPAADDQWHHLPDAATYSDRDPATSAVLPAGAGQHSQRAGGPTVGHNVPRIGTGLTSESARRDDGVGRRPQAPLVEKFGSSVQAFKERVGWFAICCTSYIHACVLRYSVCTHAYFVAELSFVTVDSAAEVDLVVIRGIRETALLERPQLRLQSHSTVVSTAERAQSVLGSSPQRCSPLDTWPCQNTVVCFRTRLPAM